MSDGTMQWPVPVTTFADRRPQNITVAMVDGEVVVKAPSVFVISPIGRQLLDEALDQAFQAARDLDQGLT